MADEKDKLPRYAQITVDRDESIWLLAFYAIAKAVHDTDEGKSQLRSRALQEMLYSGRSPFPGEPPSHESFHSLATKINRAFEAADPEGYAEIARDDTGVQPLAAFSFEEFINLLVNGGATVLKPEADEEEVPKKPPTPKSPRKRRRKDS